MQVDLREIQALHARYARKPVVIELENQIRAMPAPVMLSHQAAGHTSVAGRWWKARWKIGRVSLTVIGGAVVCAALGMGAARLWPLIHGRDAAQRVASAASPVPVQSGSSAMPSMPSFATQPLTSQSLDSTTRGTPGLTAVDPSAFTLDRGSNGASGLSGVPGPAVTQAPMAIASPIRQRAIISASAPGPAASTAQIAPVSTGASASAAAQTAEPAARPARPVRHLTHLHPTAPAEGATATANAQKAAAAPAPKSGEVQLF